MKEFLVERDTLPEAYHAALVRLLVDGEVQDCSDWNTRQRELSMTMVVKRPLLEPMISRLFIGGPQDLQQYVMEMKEGILDFEVPSKWDYTYHKRMANYPVFRDGKVKNLDQVQFVIDELKRNPSSRRAVIDIRDNSQDAFSFDPACMQNAQFFIRNNKLDCIVLFRSNDACKATFMNAFAMIMIQKHIADQLGIEVGTYTHRANSFHAYERDWAMLEGYCDRIAYDDFEDITFEYESDWKDLMESYNSSIEAKIKLLESNILKEIKYDKFVGDLIK